MKSGGAVQTMQVSTNRVETVFEVLNSTIGKRVDEGTIEKSREYIRTLKAAVQEHRKACDKDVRSSLMGLQSAVQALEKIGLEEKNLEEPSSEGSKARITGKSFLTSNKFNKRMKKRKRPSHEEADDPATRDTKHVHEEQTLDNGVTAQRNTTKDSGSARFKKNQSENHHDKNNDQKSFFR